MVISSGWPQYGQSMCADSDGSMRCRRFTDSLREEDRTVPFFSFRLLPLFHGALGLFLHVLLRIP